MGEAMREGRCFAPAFVAEYAAAHPEKVFASEDGRDKFVEMDSEAFRVILGDYVTTDDGTGIVHIAPTFGADDAKVAKDANIPALYLINKRVRPAQWLTCRVSSISSKTSMTTS